jgi:hypothetical protein
MQSDVSPAELTGGKDHQSQWKRPMEGQSK